MRTAGSLAWVCACSVLLRVAVVLSLFGVAALSVTPALAADACPNTEFREQQGMEHLPDCMALEMVSPPAKDSQPARIRHRGALGGPDTKSVSPDGNKVLFHSNALLGGSAGILYTTGGGDYYVASRESGEQRWTTSHTNPPPGLIHGWAGVSPIASAFSTDLSRWFHVASSDAQFVAGRAQAFVHGVGGSFSPLSPLLIPIDKPFARDPRWDPAGSSADSSHLYFNPSFAGVSAVYFVGDPKPSGPDAVRNTYVAQVDSSGDPSLALLARDGAGIVWGGNCGAAVGSGDFGGRNAAAVSTDGSRTYFTTRPSQPTNSTPGEPIAGGCDSAANKKRIMVRQEAPGGIEIRELIESECDRAPDLPAVPACGTTGPSGVAVPDSDDLYQGASLDSSKVYFTTGRQLADEDLDATSDLYLSDVSKPAGQRLSVISGPGDAAPSVAVISGDGSRVYFNSTEVLTADAGPSGETAQPGENNLYVHERNAALPDGRIAFIADTSAGSAWALPLLGSDPNVLGSGGDGRRLVFTSNAALTADDTDGASADVFRYDADDATLTRISKAAPGGTDNGPIAAETNIGAGDGSSNDPDFAVKGRWASDDGETVAFKTAEGLAAGDTNGITDSYVWRRGELFRLPETSDPVGKLDDLSLVSVDGDTIAFQTGAQLLPADRDFALDVYVVRPGGGFPAPPVAAEGCDAQAGGCQDAGADPVAADARTSSALGDGNVAQPERKRLAVAGLSAKARRLAARRGVLVLRVRSNRAGVVRALARGGKSRRLVGRALKRLSEAGTIVVRLRLDRRARRVLRQGRKLNLAIEVRSPGARPRSVTVALRRPQS